MKDKRGAPRYEVWFPLDIESETSRRGIAVGRDISPKGVLIATPTKFEVGADVRVTLHIPGRTAFEHELEGVIVRVERDQQDPPRAWRYRVAIQFDDEQPELEAALRALSESPT